MATVSEIITEGKARLAEAPIQCHDPLLHMKQIAELALGLDSSQLYLKWEEDIPATGLQRIAGVLDRRLLGEPFQYIAGYEWFWKSKFEVGSGVLIPRRETEQIVEFLLETSLPNTARVAELGAATGNIGISVLLERPRWEWFGFELNSQSIPFLELNRGKLLPNEARYHINPGDFFALAPFIGPYDVIVSNPPYVARSELQNLPLEVQHEPLMALDGGERGLEVIERLVQETPGYLKPGGQLVFEIGSTQAEAVVRLLQAGPLEGIQVLEDYSKHPRMAVARKRH